MKQVQIAEHNNLLKHIHLRFSMDTSQANSTTNDYIYKTYLNSHTNSAFTHSNRDRKTEIQLTHWDWIEMWFFWGFVQWQVSKKSCLPGRENYLSWLTVFFFFFFFLSPVPTGGHYHKWKGTLQRETIFSFLLKLQQADTA